MIFASPAARAASDAIASPLASISVARTVPVGPTRRAASRLCSRSRRRDLARGHRGRGVPDRAFAPLPHPRFWHDLRRLWPRPWPLLQSENQVGAHSVQGAPGASFAPAEGATPVAGYFPCSRRGHEAQRWRGQSRRSALSYFYARQHHAISASGARAIGLARRIFGESGVQQSARRRLRIASKRSTMPSSTVSAASLLKRCPNSARKPTQKCAV